MIYGENTVEIPVGNGLYLSETGDSIPSGFVRESINMEPDSQGHLTGRGDFIPMTTNMTPGDIGLPTTGSVTTSNIPPDYLNSGTVKLFRFNPTSTNQTTPALVLCRNTNPTGQKVWSTASGKGSFNAGMEQSLDVSSRRILDLTSYRDRYYACNQAKTEIYRVSDFNTASFSPPVLTTTLLFTVSGVTKLFTFADRIFALAGSKLYFTDLSTVGGYPEIWSTTNVIEMPTSRGGGSLITAVVTSNRVFLFTKAGVYVLYAQGEPNSWSLQYVTDQLITQSENSVCLIQNSIVCTDRTALYSFDGSGLNRIDEPIEDLFIDFNSFALFPFEKGFLLVASLFSDVSSVWELINTKIFYNNGIGWCEIRLTSGLEYFEETFITVVGATTPLFTFNSFNKPRSSIAYIQFDTGSSSVFLGLSHYDPALSKKAKLFSVTIPWITNPFSNLKRWVYGFIDLYSKYATFDLTMAVDGDGFGTASTITPNPLNPDKNLFQKIQTPQFNRRLSAKITLDAPTDNISDMSTPVFKIKGLQLIGNNSERQHQDTTN